MCLEVSKRILNDSIRMNAIHALSISFSIFSTFLIVIHQRCFFKIEIEYFWYWKLRIESRFLNFTDERAEKFTFKEILKLRFWNLLREKKLLNKLWANFLLQSLYIRILIMLLHRYGSKIAPQWRRRLGMLKRKIFLKISCACCANIEQKKKVKQHNFMKKLSFYVSLQSLYMLKIFC